jgi:hypothetical protein
MQPLNAHKCYRACAHQVNGTVVNLLHFVTLTCDHAQPRHNCGEPGGFTIIRRMSHAGYERKRPEVASQSGRSVSLLRQMLLRGEFRAGERISELPLVEQHRAIIEALRSGEGALAESLAREHARLARRNLEIALGDMNILSRVPGASLIRRTATGFTEDRAESSPILWS